MHAYLFVFILHQLISACIAFEIKHSVTAVVPWNLFRILRVYYVPIINHFYFMCSSLDRVFQFLCVILCSISLSIGRIKLSQNRLCSKPQ